MTASRNWNQEADREQVIQEIEKKTNSRGQPLKQSWKNMHSRIWHAIMDTHGSKKRAKFGSELGKRIIKEREVMALFGKQ